jgi:hypothetical protein
VSKHVFFTWEVAKSTISVPSVSSVLSRAMTVPKLIPAPSVPSSVLGKSCARFSDKYCGHMMGHLPLVGATSHSGLIKPLWHSVSFLILCLHTEGIRPSSLHHKKPLTPDPNRTMYLNGHVMRVRMNAWAAMLGVQCSRDN